MPTQLSRPSIQLLALLVGILLLTGFAYSVSALADDDHSTTSASGRLEVDGPVYRFAPTTCTITDSDFLAAGTGEIDGERFRVSASPDRVNLAIGSSTTTGRAGTDDLWLMSVDKVSWEIAERSIVATVTMRDERNTNAPNLDASLSVDCPAV